jgi:hypothetical protein
MRIEPRTNRKPAMMARAASCAVLLAVVCGLVFMFNLAFADQPVAGNSAKGFKTVLDFFSAPHELQMHSLLEGTQTELGPNGTIILHNAKLQTFHEDGTKEMIMNAPRCVYDYGSHVVHSDGPIKMQMWDEDNKHAYQVQGTNGFYWQQTNSYIIVSNGQTTTITGSLTNSFIP